MDGPTPMDARTPGGAGGGDAAFTVATALSGDLPCVSCGYNLRGLSIRGACPECGTAVKATILAAVDPRAEELAPVRWPRLIGWGVVAWAGGALGACLAIWALRLDQLAGPVLSRWVDLGLVAVGLIGVSGLASLAIVRPHGGLGLGAIWRAVFGVVWYAPIIWVTWHVLIGHDGRRGGPMIFGGEVDEIRTRLRLVTWACVAMVMVGLRANVRVLRSRSLVMRTGRVETQPLSPLVAAVGLAAAGDGLNLVAGATRGLVHDLAQTFGVVMVMAGSFLFTLGLAWLLLDAWRIRRALVRPSASLTAVFGGSVGREHVDGDRGGGGDMPERRGAGRGA